MTTGNVTNPATQSNDRPFRLSDAMILMAALAVALIWDRSRIIDPVGWISSLRNYPIAGLVQRLLMVDAVNALVSIPPLLAVASVAVLALRLRRPRPPLNVLAREPGTVACAVASFIMVPASLVILTRHYQASGSLGVAWKRAGIDLQPEYLGGLTFLIGLAIAVTWFVIKSRRWWVPAAGWLDRLGRLLGVGWILMIIGVVIVNVIALIRLL
jgi:hypothetical protein